MTYSDNWPRGADIHLSDDALELLLEENSTDSHLISCWECTQRAIQSNEFDRLVRNAVETLTFGKPLSSSTQ